MLTGSSNGDEIASEGNSGHWTESRDTVNLSSLGSLQNKHRRINHRRNKSEPFAAMSGADSSASSYLPSQVQSASTSSTNESCLSSRNAFDDQQDKSAIKATSMSLSPSTNPPMPLQHSPTHVDGQLQDKSVSSSSCSPSFVVATAATAAAAVGPTTKKKRTWFYVSDLHGDGVSSSYFFFHAPMNR